MEYTISSDREKLDIDLIHDYLCHQSYWAKGRSRERVVTSIENAKCFGMYTNAGAQIGFARVISDNVVFAYLMDLFIVERFRGQGLGCKLVEHILSVPEFQVRLWFLGTKDAHGLYKKYGFQALDEPSRFMLKRDVNLL